MSRTLWKHLIKPLSLCEPLSISTCPMLLGHSSQTLFSSAGPHYPIAGHPENISRISDTCHQLFSLAWWDRFVVPQSLLQRQWVLNWVNGFVSAGTCLPCPYVCIAITYSPQKYELCLFFVVCVFFPDSYMVSTRWRWPSTTTWTSTVHTTRRHSRPSAWSATSSTWLATTATSPATTSSEDSNVGSAIGHWAPVGHSSSPRSFSSLHPFPWALSSARDTSTTTSVSSFLYLNTLQAPYQV